MKPHKNLVTLIKAYKMICQAIPQDLVIVGKKDGFINGVNNISALVEGYEDRIVFTGYVDDSTLQQYVLQSDGMIFPSLYEGFGLPIIEAMAAGKKVFASDIPVICEICDSNVVYFNPLDINSIKASLLHNRNVYACKDDIYIKYNWKNTTEKFISILISD